MWHKARQLHRFGRGPLVVQAHSIAKVTVWLIRRIEALVGWRFARGRCAPIHAQTRIWLQMVMRASDAWLTRRPLWQEGYGPPKRALSNGLQRGDLWIVPITA